MQTQIWKKTLRQQEKGIQRAYETVRQDEGTGETVCAAGQWLYDNYYLMQQQLNMIKEEFPWRAFLRQTEDGAVPRVFLRAQEILRHNVALQPETLAQQLCAWNDWYCEELWVLPDAMRLVCFRRLASLCGQVEQTQTAYAAARRAETTYLQDGTLPLSQNHKQRRTYIQHLAQRLRQQGNSGRQAMMRLRKQLEAEGQEPETLSAEEYECQAKCQARMGEAVRALISVRDIDWRTLMEQVCPAEQTLLQDPDGVYAKMDMESRNLYLEELVRLAKKLRKTDLQLAQKALELAQGGQDEQTRHVGYYLVGEGQHLLTGERKPSGAVPRYIAAVVLTALLLGTAAAIWTRSPAVGIVLLIPFLQIAAQMVQMILRPQGRRRGVVKLDIKKCEEMPSVLLVVPALVPNVQRGKELLRQIEQYAYACRLQGIYFALAGDLKEANQQKLPEDDEIAETLCGAVQQMNAGRTRETFFYLQRERQYAPAQKVYTGWERKRGALMELNRLIAGQENGYTVQSGKLPPIDYVLTLDADAVLPYDTAAKLIGAVMHPLNRPQVEQGIVTKGYGIVKPGEVVSVEAAEQTAFTKIFAGRGGISRYASPADYYQLAFGESIYMGKGIYDPKLFLRLLEETVPDNRVLSHDLLEGAFVRCGYAADAVFLESYPAGYLSFMQREHRWIRGDWQLLPFLLPRMRDRQGRRQRNPLSALSRWEILDNLFRSFTPLAQLTALGIAPFCGGWKLAVIALASIFFPAVVTAAKELRRRRGWRNTRRSLRVCLWQFVFLAHQAYVALDAATRTVWRLCVTKKNLLEWTTSAETERKRKDAWTAYQRRMCFSSCMAVYMLFAAMVCPTFWGWNIVLAAIWLAAPYAAWYISRWKERIEEKLVAADRQYLRQTARKMWRYFEDYSRPAAHYIPPDNIQINPPIPPTDQTSPTNIGLALLAALAAWDFGFITKSHMTTYLQRIAGTVDRLEKWNGHLYNWYDTKTLRVLPPRYISTVDSGNLAGDLLALSQGLREAAAQPLQEKENLRQGLLDTLALVQQEGAEINESILHEQDWNRFLQKTLSWLQTIEKSPWQEICIRQVQEIMDEQGMDETCVNNDCLKLANWALNLSEQMDFSALYDKNKGLFTIGYQEEQKQFTPSYYDLLASEARQTSFVAIAKGDVPAEHWQRLSRVPLYKGGRAGLASWSGTMFEYYMPRLLLRNVPHSVFAETYQYVLDAQKQYAQRRGIPWGTSESAYATFDGSWRYQYYAFGNPTLALKSGQGKDAVVAPYATQLALMETPKEAIQNLKWLETLGAGGRYGFYEAVDWTPRRQLRGKDYTVVKSYMVHHLGMGLLAMHDVLQNHAMQRRFLRDARMQSADYLQQERMAERMKKSSRCPETANPVVQMKFHEISCARTVSDLRQDVPEVQLLSNSMFSTLVDSGGGGYLKGGDTMMTRFRALGGAPPYGTFFYCRETGRESWSPALLPVGGAQQYETTFTTHMAAFRAKMEGIVSTYEITVSPEDPLEVRKLTFQNETEQERRLEVTSYVEPCMMRQQADVAHMAFGKLFIRTQYVEDRQMLLAEKRPREAEELPLLLFHQICTPEMDGNITFETSRERFVGRCRSLHEPAALQQSLSCTQGAAVDPCLSLRCTVTIPPQESVTLYYLTGMSRSKEEALQLAQKHRFAASCETVFERSLARSNVVHEYLHISDEEEALAMQLLRHVLYRTPHAQAQVQQSTNKLGQAALWRLGISGDYPIVLCTLKQQAVLPELLLKIHMFWKLRGFACDLVFLLEEQDSYHRPVEEQLRECMNQSQGTESVFICRRELLQSGEEELLRTVARIWLDGGKELDGQLHLPPEVKPPELQQLQGGAVEQQRPPLLFWNGIGGFDPQSGEYVIWLEEDVKTPLPWVNVIAGKQLGFLCSESGSGFTYAYNSREYKLTPWSNDFVEDPPGEWFLLQDVQKGNSWSVTRSPAPSAGVYRIRHGFGYSVYRHDAYEIAGELTVFAAQEQPVKISLIKLKNLGKETRRISIKYHAVPVMGVSEAENARYIQTQQQEGMITVRNCYPSELPDNHMTLCAAGAETAVEEWNRCPCLTLVKTVELEPDACITVPFLMGCGNAAAWQSLQQEKDACTELQHVKAFWTDFLGKIRVETPDESINLLVNGRLLYQTYAARMLARSGFYQTSGAFGFRDQLQDSLALLYGNAPLCKQQILKHAAKQYEEGDVQHWWHDNLDGQETVSRGIRTKFSDDLVWLAYVTAQYVKKTGDTDLLHEQIPFLKDAPLEAEDERYGLAQVSEKTADIYTHCVLAVNRSLQRGSHGLPLMGSGDWNDGMNRVGNHGTGESVWLGFFLYKVMEEFLPLCRLYGDQETEKRYQTELQMLKTALNQTAWDGEWFLRAFFDDGTPLGSRGNEECKIDLIAQSWAVISGAAQPEKAQCAMRAVQEHLVDKENKLIRLLAPAFDTAPMDPGYIKSYLPGVRENGGQYTHAAVWYVWAWAVLGEAAQTAQQWALLNPILHGTTWEEIQQYKTEPYVAAADIYSANGQEGRGGWSWYTGAAGWMYSLLIEMILGIKKEGDKLRIEPVVLPAWKSFRIHYTYGSTVYEITAMQDDEKENTTSIHLQDDGKKHEITIYYKKEAQY